MPAFKKGQSGNPSGRPTMRLSDGRSLRDIAREHTDDAIKTLVEVMGDVDAPHAARTGAAGQLLDRGWGKPTQPLSGDDTMPPLTWAGAPLEALTWAAAQSIDEDATTH